MINIICEECKKSVPAKTRRTKLCTSCSAERAKKRCREYKKRNREKISKYNSRYKQENKNIISQYNKEYDKKHRKEIQKRQTRQHKERRKIDMEYKMFICLKNRLSKFYRGENAKIRELLGCSASFLIEWLEHLFTTEMSWENHGTYWHVDHVIMCSYFDLTKFEDRKLCFNWRNLRPLKASVNMSLKKPDFNTFLLHEIRIKTFKKDQEDTYFGRLATKVLEKSNSGLS